MMEGPRPSKGGPEDEETLTCPMKWHSQALTPASGREILSLQWGFGVFLGQFSVGLGNAKYKATRGHLLGSWRRMRRP